MIEAAAHRAADRERQSGAGAGTAGSSSPGFLIYMPVFAADEFGRHLKGFIYSPFNAQDFLASALELETARRDRHQAVRPRSGARSPARGDHPFGQLRPGLSGSGDDRQPSVDRRSGIAAHHLAVGPVDGHAHLRAAGRQPADAGGADADPAGDRGRGGAALVRGAGVDPQFADPRAQPSGQEHARQRAVDHRAYPAASDQPGRVRRGARRPHSRAFGDARLADPVGLGNHARSARSSTPSWRLMSRPTSTMSRSPGPISRSRRTMRCRSGWRFTSWRRTRRSTAR